MRLAVCYYPEHWPESQWTADAANMRALGLFDVRIGEFAWSRIEPTPDALNWDWLDRAIDTLGDAGLNVIMSTPTATPPRWMVDRHPDMLAVDAAGQPRNFGSRRHYCFSHAGYKAECARIASLLGERYGRHAAITGWQIDNEYGCHDTTLSYSHAAREEFRAWLNRKYKDIDALNTAWGNVFWSMDYQDFDQIELPNLTVTEANPAHVMDFRRFSSDQVVAFNRIQIDALRPLTEALLIHNYMGRITDFDHFDVGADLDISSWDSYPLGFLEDRSDAPDDFRHRFSRQGDPDFGAFHHDLYRAVGRGRWGVMEQQPGPVNWAPYNPAPLPGMVRLWSWEAFAHGAEFVSYFRWRQAPFAQEQMHAGLRRSDDAPADAYSEVKALAEELTVIQPAATEPAPIAIVFDYASAWAWETQPQGQDFDYFRLVFDVYRALRKRGLSIDILPPSCTDFGKRKAVFIPGLFAWTDALRGAVKQFDGRVIIGPRTGSKTADFQIPNAMPPDFDALPVTVTSVESLRPSNRPAVSGGGHVQIWREYVESDLTSTFKTEDGQGVLWDAGHLSYLSAWPDAALWTRILDHIDLPNAGLPSANLPDGIRCRDFGPYRLYVNYAPEPQSVGEHLLEPASILLINRKNGAIILDH